MAPGVRIDQSLLTAAILEGRICFGIFGELVRRLVKQVEVRSSANFNFSGVFGANFSIPCCEG